MFSQIVMYHPSKYIVCRVNYFHFHMKLYFGGKEVDNYANTISTGMKIIIQN